MTRRALTGLAAVVCLVAGAVAWTGRTEAAPSVAAAEAPALDGAALFQAKGCASCHAGPDGEARIGIGFPDLRAAPTWDGRGRPGQSAAEYVAESVVEPWAVIAPGFSGVGPTLAMPKLALSDAEVRALVAYLVDR